MDIWILPQEKRKKKRKKNMHVYKLNIVQKKKRKKRNAQLLLDKTKDTELSQALARSERINKSCTTLEHTERSAQNESRKRETICRLAAPKCTRTHACVRACTSSSSRVVSIYHG